MAGRPLSGRVVETSSGRFDASLPEHRGSKRRHHEYFDGRAEAEAWLTEAIRAVKAGLPIQAPSTSSWFERLAFDWFERVYMIEQRAQPKRARQVRRHIEMYIIPWFATRWPAPTDVHVDDCHTFMQFLSGRRDAQGAVTLGPLASQQRSLDQSTAGGIRSTLVSILADGVARRIVDRNVAEVADASKPLGASKKRKAPTPTAVPLVDAARVAQGLHVLHQLAMWMQRIGGLRIGEAYGPRVGEIIRDGDYGIYVVDSQGGQNYEFWNDCGEAEIVAHIARVKGETSYRVMVLGPSLMGLVELVEAAFHTNPDGSLDVRSPLIPGIHALDGGAAGYQTALKIAANGVFTTDSLSSHDLRKGLCTDLAFSMDLTPVLQRRIVGHAAGDDVHGRIYILDHPDLVALKNAANQTEALIKSEIGSLLVATTKMPAFARTHPLYDRLPDARRILTNACALIDDRDGLSSAEVGALIGRAETTARRLIAGGVIKGRKRRNRAGVDLWTVDPKEVERFLASYGDRRTIDEAAEHFGITYHQLYRLLGRLGTSPMVDPVTTRVLVDDEQMSQVAAELDRLQSLNERSMRIPVAAAALGRPVTTIRSWVDIRLDRDSETDATGAAYVTRASVDRLRKSLSMAPQRPTHLPGR